MVKLSALAMAAMMIVSPVSCVWAAENVDETAISWEDDQGEENGPEAEEGMGIVDDGGVIVYGNQGMKYIIKVKSAKVRSGPGISYSVVVTLEKGRKISVLSCSNGWAKFRYNGRNVYVHENSIEKV